MVGDADGSRERSSGQVSAELSEVTGGIRRLTFQLPLAIKHVHCYFVPGDSGAWMLVDTAIGYPGVEQHWRAALKALGGPVEKILITHFHPDHVGGARLVAGLTGAPGYQGSRDF